MKTLADKLTGRLSVHSLLDRQTTQITAYLEYLLKVNQSLSLTRVGDFESWFTTHVEDSLMSYKEFEKLEASGFVDCGSGNGLPGIIYGILSGLPFTVCDVDLRKCEFLKATIFKLKLEGKVFSRPIIEYTPPMEGKNFCYVYRGLGPDKILIENFEARPTSSHFRLISGRQSSLSSDSIRKKYFLSDKSSREIEILL